MPPIPHEAIEGFIRNLRLVGAEQYDGLPYVITNEERRLLAAELDNTYVRGLDAEVGDFVSIMRRGSIYYRKGGEIRRAVEPGYGQHAPTRIEHHPTVWESAANFGGNRGDIVGHELYEVAEAMVVKTGEISIVTLGGGSDIEVMEGDVIMPLDDIGYVDQYMPRAMEAVPQDLHILAVQGDNRLVGTYKMVSINGGARQGIEPGHVFSAFRPGDKIRDRVKYPAGSLAGLSLRRLRASGRAGRRPVRPDRLRGMRVVLQRVSEARVRVDARVTGEIGPGLLLLCAFRENDTDVEMQWMADKLCDLRIFRDDEGRTNRSLIDIGGAMLVVSQFTLAADTNKGNRPSFTSAAPPEEGLALFDDLVARARQALGSVPTGEFGADMAVALVNDGPVTFRLRVPPPG